MRYTISIPEGTRDLLFSQCAGRRRAENAICSLFRRRGYSEVNTPEVEYYDLFTCSGNPLSQESMLKIIDRSGKIMVMRPDNTTPIARVAATKLKSIPLPHRLCYNQTVFRSDGAHLGSKSEIDQCGVELIGASGVRADVEVIALAVDALAACGLGSFHVELGHAGFFRALAKGLGADESATEAMRGFIEGKNFAALNDALSPYEGRAEAVALRKLCQLFGGVEVIEEAKRLYSGAESDQALGYLLELYKELEAAGCAEYIRFDLGLVHRIEYYTGVVFRGYCSGAGSSVLAGGRYDSLVGMFGVEAPATGFAIDVDAVAQAMESGENGLGLDTLVYYEKGSLRAALSFVEGESSGRAQLSVADSPEQAAEEARRRSIPRLVCFCGDKMTEVAL